MNLRVTDWSSQELFKQIITVMITKIIFMFFFFWLVVSNIFYFSIYLVSSSQLTFISFRGVGSTTNQFCLAGFISASCGSTDAAARSHRWGRLRQFGLRRSPHWRWPVEHPHSHLGGGSPGVGMVGMNGGPGTPGRFTGHL